VRALEQDPDPSEGPMNVIGGQHLVSACLRLVERLLLRKQRGMIFVSLAVVSHPTGCL